MKNIAITIFIVLLVVVLVLFLVSFQVRETQFALKVTFGNATSEDQIKEPGWYFRWPFPIQRIHKFDSRMRILEVEITETPTKGDVPIIVNTYVVWKIAEPLKFFKSVGAVVYAEDYLGSQLRNTQGEVIGQHNFSQFVNSDKSKIEIKEIQEKMLSTLQQAVIDDYGIEIKTLGIKQLKVSEDVSKAVFARMITERSRRTAKTISEGDAEAKRIRDDAIYKEKELIAAAKARAKIIRGRGDADAAKYYKMLEADPEFAMFLREIDAAKEALKERATVILREGSWLVSLLKEMPDIKPRKSTEPK
ncbi:MAG: protease modulator HflC [Planctomycetota bacterium]|jgi:membrane protease subunit HflC